MERDRSNSSYDREDESAGKRLDLHGGVNCGAEMVMVRRRRLGETEGSSTSVSVVTKLREPIGFHHVSVIAFTH